MAPPRILIVDDDAGLRDLLTMALEDAGFAVESARDGEAGWQAFRRGSPDLVILDVIMPEVDGLELCRRIRRAGATPIVMLTSKDEEIDTVLGLEMGADDYVTKPFSNRELIARVRAVLRRGSTPRHQAEPEAVSVRGLRLDRPRHQVELGGAPVGLTVSEFELLWALLAAPGRVLSRQDLIDAVYGADVVVTDRTIDTFVKRVRSKLRAVDPTFDELETIRGVGYRYRA